MKNIKIPRYLIILVLLLSLGTNIYLYVKYSDEKKDMANAERYAKNLYHSEIVDISNDSYRVLSEDKVSLSLEKIDKASAYIWAVENGGSQPILSLLKSISSELTRQIGILYAVVRKNGVEDEFAKELHSTIINELIEVESIIREDNVDLEKLGGIRYEISMNTTSYEMRYYSDSQDD